MMAWWILGAFGLGFFARQLGMPPLVGFLAAGFVLHALGLQADPAITRLGEIGVWMLLFTVGLKLRFRSLIRPEVWMTSLIHLAITGGLAALFAHHLTALPWTTAWLLGASFGFSSTVLAAITLEPRRELRAFHGRVVIGILIVQDLVAVALLAFGNARALPAPYVPLLLLFLALARPLFGRLLSLAGHDELLPLLGVLLVVAGGGYGFRELGLSAELGSLLLGAVLAGHPRATELSHALWGMKEIFLVGFFVGVGLHGVPTLDTLLHASLLMLAIPLKALVFFALLLLIGLRARSSFLAALGLASYSEFGLIVMQAGVREGLLDAQWLPLAAVTVAISFAVGASLNRSAHGLHARCERFLQRFERSRRHPDDEPVSVGTAEVLVVGMGRVGSGAYRYLKDLGLQVVGLDSDMNKVERHLRDGLRVVYADAEDPDLWQRLRLDKVRAVMLALPDVEAKVLASRQLRQRGFSGLIAATHVYEDERASILAAGCNVTYNYFHEAGTGFAAHVTNALKR